jgi:hypothetical protein
MCTGVLQEVGSQPTFLHEELKREVHYIVCRFKHSTTFRLYHFGLLIQPQHLLQMLQMLLYLFVADQYRQIQVKIVTFNTSTTNHCILQNHQMRQQIVSDVAYHTSRVHGKVLQSSRDVNLFISGLSQTHVTQQRKTYNLNSRTTRAL